MKRSDIEYWALKAIERARAGGQDEDSFVEFKQAWIEPTALARQLAGHANSARTEPILWIFGVSKTGEVLGVEGTDLAKFGDVLRSRFDGPAPRPIDIALEVDGKQVVAIQFDTDQPPYVIKHDKESRRSVEREVPWRVLTGTQSATHNDLLKVLVPISKKPMIELENAEIFASSKECFATIRLFIDPGANQHATFRFKDCAMTLRKQDTTAADSCSLELVPGHTDSTLTVQSKNQVMVKAPCEIGFRFFFGQFARPENEDSFVASLKLRAVESHFDVVTHDLCFPSSGRFNNGRRWIVAK
jgi:hypothetical protein